MIYHALLELAATDPSTEEIDRFIADHPEIDPRDLDALMAAQRLISAEHDRVFRGVNQDTDAEQDRVFRGVNEEKDWNHVLPSRIAEVDCVFRAMNYV